MSGAGRAVAVSASPRREFALLLAAFLPLFAGPGALQLYLGDLYAAGGRAVVSRDLFLAVTYGAMGVSRLLVGWTVGRLSDRPALVVGAAGYALFAAAQWPGLNGWWLVPVALGFGFGAAWVWLLSGAAVLDLSRRAAPSGGLASPSPSFLRGEGLAVPSPSPLRGEGRVRGGRLLRRVIATLTLALSLKGRGGFGRGAGLLYGASTLAQGVGVMGLGLLVAAGWVRTAVLAAAGLGAVAVGLFAARRPGPARREVPSLRVLLRFAADRRLLLVGLFLMVGSLPFGLILSAFRDHVSDRAPVWAVVPCFFLARSLMSVVGGEAVDRLGRGRTLAGAFAVGAAALALTPSMSATVGLALAALMIGVQMSLTPVAGTALVGDITSGGHRPVALGVLFFWRDVGAVAGILGGTWLRGLFGAGGAGFLVFAAVLAVFAGLSFVLERWAGRPAPLSRAAA